MKFGGLRFTYHPVLPTTLSRCQNDSCHLLQPGITVARHPTGGCHGTGDAAFATSPLQDAVDLSTALSALPGCTSRRSGGDRVTGGWC